MIPVVHMPLYTYPPCDPATDAHRLHRALKGLGTDTTVLISIMAHRSKNQLQQIMECYSHEHKHSLEKDIIGDTSGNYQTLLVDLLRPVNAYRVESIRKAVKGGTKESTRESILIDVITQCSNADIQQIKSLYPDIEKDISNDTSANLKKVLLELLKGNRQETNVIDDAKAEAVAQELHKAGEHKIDLKFVEVMTTYSSYFLNRVNIHYARLYKESLYKAIEKRNHWRL